MFSFPIDPFNKTFAITEIVGILAFATVCGYILARLIMKNRLTLLRKQIELKQIDLAECRAIIRPELTSPRQETVHFSKMVQIEEEDPDVTDDLKILEGIGPRIEEILNKHGVKSFSKLSGLTPVRIAAMLRTAGPRYQIHDPSSWPQQANLARVGKWEELEALKLQLISGRNV